MAQASVVICLRRDQTGTSPEVGARDLRAAVEVAKEHGAEALLRSPSRAVVAWPLREIPRAFALLNGVFTRWNAVSAGVATGTLALTQRGEREVMWGRAVFVATRLAEAAPAGTAYLEARVTLIYPAVYVNAPEDVCVGKTNVSACAWRADALQRPRLWGKPSVSLAQHIEDVTGRQLGALLGAAGTLSVLCAPRGAGGTYALETLALEVSAAGRLWLGPVWGAGPLSALREAFLRGVNRRTMEQLSRGARDTLLRLTSWQDVGSDECVDLVVSWFAEDTAPGVVFIDDAAHVDKDSLDVIAAALGERGAAARVVLHVEPGVSLPEELRTLSLATTSALAEWSPAQLAVMAQRLLGVGEPSDVARAWAQAAGSSVLGLSLALHEASANGMLQVEDGVIYGAPLQDIEDLSLLVVRRLEALEPPDRAVVVVLAMMGGSADLKDLGMVLGRRALWLDAAALRLTQQRWLRRVGRDRYSLGSHTVVSAVLENVGQRETGIWHTRLAHALADQAGTWAQLRYTLHMVLAGQDVAARRMAASCANGLARAGLPKAAAAFQQFAAGGEFVEMCARGYARKPPLVRRPTPLALAKNLETHGAVRDASGSAVEAQSVQIQGEPDRVPLLQRLDALVRVTDERKGGALASLRLAVEEAMDPAARCRATLAYAVGLAAVGRNFDAMLVTMEALARAREGGLQRAERACVLFLRDLARADGQLEALAALDVTR